MVKEKKANIHKKSKDITKEKLSVGRNPGVNFAFKRTSKPPQKPTNKGGEDDDK